MLWGGGLHIPPIESMASLSILEKRSGTHEVHFERYKRLINSFKCRQEVQVGEGGGGSCLV